MEYRSFDQLAAAVRQKARPARMAVAAAADPHTLEAAFAAMDEGIVLPVLVGDLPALEQLLHRMGRSLPPGSLYHQPDPEAAARMAVALVREGKADFLMKGKLDTAALLRAVVDKETGLGRGGVMSHFTIFEVPGYHKLLTVVDGGMVTYPTLEQKAAIVQNTVDILLALGCPCPKVGVLACVEKVNPKMPETLDADALVQMNREGLLKNCLVEGPISYDCAMSAEIARVKGYQSRIAGQPDILLAPNIHAGNIMGKMLLVTCGAKMAGMVAGAACPIVLTSRGSSAQEKYLSILLSAAAVGGLAR